jgi:hypothetical protein
VEKFCGEFDMKIFADFHHSGLARSLVLALQVRLGHEVYFPGANFVENTIQLTGGHHVLLSCLPSWTLSLGGFPESLSGEWEQLVTYESFMETDWDVFLVTRVETQRMFRELKKIHPNGDKIKVIAQNGNDGVVFDWDLCKNFMASDEASFRKVPQDVNSIWYMQELGMQYMEQEWVPLDEVSVKKVNSFVNCWSTFTSPWRWDGDLSTNDGRCPHCSTSQCDNLNDLVEPYNLWLQAKENLPDHEFGEYGIACTFGCIPEVCLPTEYVKGGLTVHMKTYDGYGHSMLQSIACGRLVVVPKGFHRYRTAGRVLIPNLTCLESEWTAESLTKTISDFTSDLALANDYSYGCWKASKEIFNWTLEGQRLKKFMENLV